MGKKGATRSAAKDFKDDPRWFLRNLPPLEGAGGKRLSLQLGGMGMHDIESAVVCEQLFALLREAALAAGHLHGEALALVTPIDGGHEVSLDWLSRPGHATTLAEVALPAEGFTEGELQEALVRVRAEVSGG